MLRKISKKGKVLFTVAVLGVLVSVGLHIFFYQWETKLIEADFAAMAGDRIVTEVLETYRKEIENKRHVMTSEVSKDAGKIWADRDKLSGVLINLLSNAIKYTPKGGSLGLKVAGSAKDVRFEFSDSGPGIGAEDQKKIFDKFERILVEKQEGTGLGFPIAKEIVELHKGKIWIESEPGHGSKFIFVLPRDLRTRVGADNRG